MLVGQHGTIGTIMIIFFLQGMLDGQHGTIGTIMIIIFFTGYAGWTA
jgi:hypothetical protein